MLRNGYNATVQTVQQPLSQLQEQLATTPGGSWAHSLATLKLTQLGLLMTLLRSCELTLNEMARSL